MKNISILGIYKFTNPIVMFPDKRCLDCLLFDDVLCWCVWYKRKIHNSASYNEDCRIRKITIEEE